MWFFAFLVGNAPQSGSWGWLAKIKCVIAMASVPAPWRFLQFPSLGPHWRLCQGRAGQPSMTYSRLWGRGFTRKPSLARKMSILMAAIRRAQRRADNRCFRRLVKYCTADSTKVCNSALNEILKIRKSIPSLKDYFLPCLSIYIDFLQLHVSFPFSSRNPSLSTSTRFWKHSEAVIWKGIVHGIKRLTMASSSSWLFHLLISSLSPLQFNSTWYLKNDEHFFFKCQESLSGFENVERQISTLQRMILFK